jgi:hypothetical protein
MLVQWALARQVWQKELLAVAVAVAVLAAALPALPALV